MLGVRNCFLLWQYSTYGSSTYTYNKSTVHVYTNWKESEVNVNISVTNKVGNNGLKRK